MVFFLRNFDEDFFYWLILAKFWLEKYDFDLYKGFFFWKKMAQISQILKKIKSISPYFLVIKF
jgi:hypothetical protein